MTVRIVHQVFYGHVDGKQDETTGNYHYMMVSVLGERFYDDDRPTTGPECFGRVEDTPENRALAVELIGQLRAAEAKRDLAANNPLFADSVKKSFRRLAEDFWEQNGFDLGVVFAPANGVGKGMVSVSKDVVLPEPLPSWWTNGEE